LPRVVPLGIAMEMLLSGDLITSQEAHRIGLVNQVVPDSEVTSAAIKMAEDSLTAHPGVSQRPYIRLSVLCKRPWRSLWRNVLVGRCQRVSCRSKRKRGKENNFTIEPPYCHSQEQRRRTWMWGWHEWEGLTEGNPPLFGATR
jgi:enoyl-CoA hydratase/carnithine racemase